MGPGFETEGSFESDTFDAKIFSHWGRLTWWGDNGAASGKVAFYVRSGNTSSPEKNWSAWSGPYKNAAGETVNCPPARFVQWKAVFLDTDHEGRPNVSWVNLAYQPKNVAPEIDDIAIQDPGVRVQGFAQQVGGPGSAVPAPVRMPQRRRCCKFSAGARRSPAENRCSSAGISGEGLSKRGVERARRQRRRSDFLGLLSRRGRAELAIAQRQTHAAILFLGHHDDAGRRLTT